MNRKLARLALIAIGLAAAPRIAKAQYNMAPPMDMSHIINANIAFDRWFDQYAWQKSVELARQMKPGEQLPFNAMTISKSLTEGNQAFGRYMQSVQAGSASRSRMADNYSNYAIRGLAPYGNPGGPTYNLPYTHNAYTITPNGYAIPGVHYQAGTPIYGR
jgi:hypothetical protein